MADQTKDLKSLNETLMAFIEKGQELYSKIEKVIQPVQKQEPTKPMIPKLEKSVSVSRSKKKETSPGRARAAKSEPSTSMSSTGTIFDAVMGVVRSNREGVTTEQIQAKTGLEARQIWTCINRAKIEGKVKTAKRGIYLPV